MAKIEQGLDFWATDAWTDSALPIFDDWSVQFCLQEWRREVLRDEIRMALCSKTSRAFCPVRRQKS
jgi:hypothetical protein